MPVHAAAFALAALACVAIVRGLPARPKLWLLLAVLAALGTLPLLWRRPPASAPQTDAAPDAPDSAPSAPTPSPQPVPPPLPLAPIPPCPEAAPPSTDIPTLDAFTAAFGLSGRERAVLAAVVGSEANLDVLAAEIGISHRSLQRHLTAIYAKTGTQSRPGLTTRFYRG